MTAYLVQRVLSTLLVIVGVSIVVFVLVRLTGDPVALLLPPDAPPEQVRVMRQQLALDQPLPVQFLVFAGNAVHGDFGESLRFRQPALGLLLERFPATVLLTTTAMGLALVIAVPCAVISASRRSGLLNGTVSIIALTGQSLPTFWLGLVLILLLSVNWQLFPPSGLEGPKSLVLPGFTLGAYSTAAIMRVLRSSLLEALGQEYVRTARSKGLSERAVLYGHALKNAAIPAVTVIGLQVGVLLGGAVVTEVVFAYPGIGRLALQAISSGDFPLIQAFVVLTGTLIAAINLAVDLLYAWLDPRIRYG